MKNIHFSNLLNKKIIAFRGLPHKEKYSKKVKTDLQYILFDDGETILLLDEQDYYDYHDCSSSARHLSLITDKELWDRMMNKEAYQEPDDVGFNPFS